MGFVLGHSGPNSKSYPLQYLDHNSFADLIIKRAREFETLKDFSAQEHDLMKLASGRGIYAVATAHMIKKKRKT